MTGRQLDRTAAAATVVAALSTFDRGKAVRASARDHRAQGEERRSRRRRDAGAHRALGADQALLRRDALAGAALADRAAALVALRRQHDRLDLRPRRRGVSRTALGHGLPQAAGRALPGDGDGEDRDPAVGSRASARCRWRRPRRSLRRRSRRTSGRRTSSCGSRTRSGRRRSRRRWASRASSRPTRRPTAARPGGSTTCSSSRS